MSEHMPVSDIPFSCTHPLRIDADHPCLPGHFPGQPLVPGVVLLEQVACAVRALCDQRLTRVAEVKFLAPLYPGEDAELRLYGRSSPWRFEISRGATVLAKGRVEGSA
jgi:3-hydroxyacyl-[acyl-carrier-protein] dehydratase